MLADTVTKMSKLSVDSDPDVAEMAGLATVALVERALEGVDGGAPGLVLSAQQLVNFRKYELAALALPTTVSDVINYLGYETGAGGGLDAEDFLHTFKLLNTHALQWNPLKRQISTLATTLEIFGNKMAAWNIACKQLIGEVKIAFVDKPGEAPKTFAALKASGYTFNGESHAELEVEADSARETNQELGTLMAELFEEVKRKVAEVTHLEEQIAKYANELNTVIQPAITTKKTLILKKQACQDLVPRVNAIDERAQEISRLDTAYKAGVKSALKETFAGFGPLAGIYLGIKADYKRQERNRKMAEQEEDLCKLQAARTVESALITVLYRLQQLELLVADARLSVEHLHFMWKAIVSYASESQDATRTIDDTNSLLTFQRRFNFVCEPWESVVKNSRLLLNIFDEAEKIIAADYQR